MKLLCDVCSVSPASLMCCADEACLCASCDSRIHGANKLAGKHHRLPLLHPPSSDDLPRCDICQDKAGFFFCLEDRSLLCRHCDYSIHSSNILASKHNRFLVAGIRVSLQQIDASTDSPQTCSLSNKSSSRLSSPQRKTIKVASASSNAITASSTPIPNLRNPNLDPPSVVRELNPRSSRTAANEAAEESPLFCMPPGASMSMGQQNSNSIIASSAKESYPPQRAPRGRKSQTYASNNSRNATAVISESLGMRSSSSSSTHAACNQDQQYIHLQDSHHYQGRDETGDPTTNHVRFFKTNMGGNTAPPPTFGNGYVRKGSIAEYLTETIPGWQVDEFLNLYGIGTAQSFADCGSTRETAGNSGETSSPTESNCYYVAEDCAVQRAAAEVPSMPSPPTMTGIKRNAKAWKQGGMWGSNSISTSSDWGELGGRGGAADDMFVVPDVGGVKNGCAPPAEEPPLMMMGIIGELQQQQQQKRIRRIRSGYVHDDYHQHENFWQQQQQHMNYY